VAETARVGEGEMDWVNKSESNSERQCGIADVLCARIVRQQHVTRHARDASLGAECLLSPWSGVRLSEHPVLLSRQATPPGPGRSHTRK